MSKKNDKKNWKHNCTFLKIITNIIWTYYDCAISYYSYYNKYFLAIIQYCSFNYSLKKIKQVFCFDVFINVLKWIEK